MQNTIEKLDSKGYRKFGLTTGAIIAVLFGLLIPWLFDFDLPVWPWITAGILGALALAIPSFLQPVYNIWMRFGHVMNWINTRIILGILFYGIFLPTGLVMRILGKDPMQRTLGDSISSYRVQSHNDSKDNVERPY